MTGMSNNPDTIRFIEDQLGDLDIRTRTMFDEYGIYCDEKVVGFICGDALEDRDWLQEAVQATADALPAPRQGRSRSQAPPRPFGAEQ
jgi:TfoX/Sxy family transcriptional regulator of competence genes